MQFYLLPEWRDVLCRQNLDTYQALLDFRGGDCMSSHYRGATYRLHFEDGQVIFIKQDHLTLRRAMLRSFLRGRWPRCNTAQERLNLELARQHGFTVPEVIAWGEQKRWGLPNTGVMVMLPLPGVALDKWLETKPEPKKARDMIAKAEHTLAKLQDFQLDWKTDCKPEHFFVLENGEIGLIDLERLTWQRKPLKTAYRMMQLQRFRKRLPKEYQT